MHAIRFFFYGHSEKINYKRTTVFFEKHRPAGIGGTAAVTVFSAEMDKRSTGFDGAGFSLGLNGYIGGDGYLSPVWEWHISFSGEKADFAEFEGVAIDVDLVSSSLETSISSTQTLGKLSFAAGLSFFCAYDEYSENSTGEKTAAYISGAYPFSSISLILCENTILSIESFFGAREGLSLSGSVAF